MAKVRRRAPQAHRVIRDRGEPEPLPGGAVDPVRGARCSGRRRRTCPAAAHLVSGFSWSCSSSSRGPVGGFDDDPFVGDTAELLALDHAAGQPVAHQVRTVTYRGGPQQPIWSSISFARPHPRHGRQECDRGGADDSDQGDRLFAIAAAASRQPARCRRRGATRDSVAGERFFRADNAECRLDRGRAVAAATSASN